MRIELVVTRGLAAGARAALVPGARLIVGRGDDAGLRLPDEGLSRHHVALEVGAAGVLVTDLGSKNGTRVAGQPLVAHAPAPAPDGATVTLGEHELQVRVSAPLRDDFERTADLGAGGMGHVFAARHRATGREVAIKVLHTPAEADPVARERFRREALVRVDSPHVVRTLDVRLEGPQVQLVLELVRGPSLERLLAKGPLPVARALEVGEQVALALDAAHRAGVVHRDVKPGNVLVDAATGAAKLSDFGIAKHAPGAGTLTASGTGLGTLSYMAPEQAEDAKRATAAADLYALGATLYHALAGRPPFAPGPDQVRALFEDDPPPLARLRPDAGPDVAALVHRLLEKHPDDRPPTAAVVARKLRELRARLP